MCIFISHPGPCHILVHVTSQAMPQPGQCHILSSATSWVMPHPGSCDIPGHATSQDMPHPRQCHILSHATSWVIWHPRPCYIPSHATSWAVPHPGPCHILGHVTSQAMPHPGICFVAWTLFNFFFSILLPFYFFGNTICIIFLQKVPTPQKVHEQKIWLLKKMKIRALMANIIHGPDFLLIITTLCAPFPNCYGQNCFISNGLE